MDDFFDVLLAKKLSGGGGGGIAVEGLTVTDNGTYTAPEGTAYSPVNVNVQPDLGTKSITANGTYNAVDDSLDGYSSVTVNVVPKQDFVEKWDFTTGSLTGVNGTAVTLGGSATVAENTGVSFTTGADRIYMPTQMLKAGRKIDIEFGTMERSNNSSGVVMAWSTMSSSDSMNIQYRSNLGKWIIEYPSVESSNISDAQYFSNSKMSIVIDTDSKIHLYRDDTAVWNPTTVLTFSGLNFWTIGANHNNFTYFNAVIRKITISEVPSKSELDSLIDRSITSISNDTCTSVGANAFQNCTSLTSVNFKVVTTIGIRAFLSCTSLTSIDFPVATSIRENAFESCSSLTSAYFPVATIINSTAFYNCSNLTSVNLPSVTSIKNSYAFQGCTSLTSVNLPSVTSIGSYTFSGCTSLTSVNFKVITTIGANAFQNCTSLTSVDFPAATGIGSDAFVGCISLTFVNIPLVTSLSTSMFKGCTSLTSVNLPSVTSIPNYAFQKCSKLTSLILGNTTQVCSLSNINAFTNTPFASGGTGGTLYVPRDLIASYQTATNWSVILSYPNNQILAIEDM